MPCIECENSLWRWGETGGCRYESLSQCEEDNADFYNADIDYSFHFTHEMMEDLHDDGELIVVVEKEGEEMTIRFTYDIEEEHEEEYEIEEDEIMELAKELKDINNKYKKNI